MFVYRNLGNSLYNHLFVDYNKDVEPNLLKLQTCEVIVNLKRIVSSNERGEVTLQIWPYYVSSFK